jgi:hypothetical protein
MLVFWVVTLCGCVGTIDNNVSEEHTASFRAEDGGSIFLQNVGIYLQVHTALQPRRPTSTSSPPREPQVSSIQYNFCEIKHNKHVLQLKMRNFNS